MLLSLHVRTLQGERSAHNAGIPFVVVGRRMTKDSLRKALNPFLNEQTPAEAAAREAQLAKDAERKAFADAFFSSAVTVRFGGVPMPAAAAAGSAGGGSVGRLQQLQQQRARLSGRGVGAPDSGSSGRAGGSPISSRGNRGLP
jgi:hypothetical protein